MMSQESQHLHHHHRLNDFSVIVGTPSTATAKLGTGGNELLGMEIQSPNWASFVPEGAKVSSAGPWQGSSSSMIAPHTKNARQQSLSLSLHSNIAHPPSFQFAASHHNLQIKFSKFLLPAQELLNEFCSLGGSGRGSVKRKICDKPPDESSLSWSQQTLYSMEPLELQKRKTKLLGMLDEVEKRYKRYCEQMKAVVSTFEDVAGEGAARAYSLLASMAMSRHFRRLRDGITGQLGSTRRAMGEADGAATPGLTKGNTPRLRLLDQSLRRQRAFQQAGMAESHPWRPQKGLPERSVSILRAWLFEHFLHPYPSDVDKHILARQTGLSRSQVSNWFINARVRLWKPMVEEMYVEEMKEEEVNKQSFHATAAQKVGSNSQNYEPGALQIEPHSLSSVVCSINTRRHDQNPYPNPRLGIQDARELTLGIQQHAKPMLFAREPHGNEGDVVAYRNLMGAQLLHDLTG